MASGSFIGYTNNQYITPRILWSSTSNVVTNTSDVTVTFQLMKSSASSSSTYGIGAWTININETTYNFGPTITIPANGTYVTVYQRTVTGIPHNTNGTKRMYIGVSGGISGTSYTTTTLYGDVDLDNIARASTVSSFSFTNGYIDQGFDITISSKVSSYYHDIHLYLPDTSGTGLNLIDTTVGRKAGGTHHINLTAAQLKTIYDAMPTKTSSQFTVYVRTYINATATGDSNAIGDWQTATAYGNISSNVKPTISNFTHAINSNDLDGLYVQGKSTVKFTCTATMGTGASISSYRFSGPNLETTITNNYTTSGIITSSGTLTYTVIVTDSRGRQASSQVQIYVYPYSKPGFKSTIVDRSDSVGVLNGSGTYAKYTIEGTYSSVGGKNTRTITVAHSSNNGTTYSAETTIQAATNLNAIISGVYGSGALSVTNSYLIRFTIKDRYGATATSILTLSTVSRAINIKSDNTGIAFGKISEGPGIETPWNMTFKGSGEKALVFENGSTAGWKTQLYQGSPTSTAVLGAYDVTNNRNIWAYASNGSFYINRPAYGLDGAGVNRKIILEGETEGNARQLTNVFSKHFPNSYTGYIGIRLGTTTRALNSMITIKGYVTSYHNSTSFEASCYYYSTNSTFYGTVATMSSPDVLKEVYFAEETSTGYVYLIIGASNAGWSYPTISIDTLSIGFSGQNSTAWESGWTANIYTNLSSFKNIASCPRGGMKATLWSGAINVGKTITLSENLRNFSFLTCITGDATSPYGIVLVSLLDDEISELHFFAFTTNSYAASEYFGAKFVINNQTSLTLAACGTSVNNTLYCRKIVGWR